MTKLEHDHTLKRQITVSWCDSPLAVTITATGVTLAVKGSRRAITATWHTIAGHAATSQAVPAKLYGRPIELLQDEARRRHTKEAA